MAERLESRVLMAVQPVINEFLASNANTNSDEDGEFSDWIEIHNPNSTAISLDGYYLTDDQNELTKWMFPDVALAPNAYLLVWASDKDRTDPTKPLHANLKLSDEGEYLGLVAPDGVTAVSDFGPRFPQQTTDISYGVPAGGGGAADFLTPTPGAANNLGSPVAALQFDHDRGLHTTPFALALSTATDGASIRYTLDGTRPTPNTGTLYTGPIHIDNTTVVRAIGYKTGSTSTAVREASYIFPAMVLQQPEHVPGYPSPPEPINNPGRGQVDVQLTYGMDPTIVNDPRYARQALDGLSQIPTLSVGVDPGFIFGDRGFYDTPREIDPPPIPISFEFIDPNNPQNNIGLGAAISAHSDQQVKRSFHIHFSRKYGPSKLKGSIFDGAPLGGDSATDEFDDLILRAGNHRSWAYTSAPLETTYTEDEYVRQTQIAMTGQGTHGMFVHLYINGLYWGLYNVAERLDEGYGEAYFNVKEEDYFSIANNELKSGDPTRWNYMLDTLAEQDMSIGSNYARMREYLDVNQFADYLIGQWFCGVSDWPANNYWAAGDMSKDEPFKFYAWDGEFMMTTVDRYPTIPHGPWVNPAFRNDPGNALYRDIAAGGAPIMKLWRALKQSPDFLAMFADEVSKNLADGGPLSDANALARWNALNDSISNAIVAESARWGDSTAAPPAALEVSDPGPRIPPSIRGANAHGPSPFRQAPSGGRTYTKVDWINARQAVAKDLQGAAAKFLAALHAEGLYPFNLHLGTDGTLLLRGSGSGDAIDLQIRQSDGRLVASVGDVVRSFKPSQVKRIRVYGFGGDDAITVGSGVRLAFADGGAGNDTILGGDGDDVLFGGDGADHIEGRAGGDRIAAGVGDDAVFGDYADGTPHYGSDTIEGNAGNDVLVGGGNNDVLLGEGGADTLIGGGANDRMSGGPGVDDMFGGPGDDSAEDSDQDIFDSIEAIL